MRFRDVVLCDNRSCGAILRLRGEASIRVMLERDALSAYFICPRCGGRTNVASEGGDPVLPVSAQGPREKLTR